jgi:diguanylate cyclase (GGDEF)-like protein
MGESEPHTSHAQATARVMIVVLASYVTVAAATSALGLYLGLEFAWWTASGVAFAAIYVWGWRLAPVVFAGSAVVGLLVLSSTGPVTASGIALILTCAIGAAAQALIGALLVRRVVGRQLTFTGAREIVWFLVLGGVVVTLFAATLVTVAQVGLGLLSASNAPAAWITWWVGDAIGVVVFAPITLMLIPSQRSVWHGRRLRIAIPSLTAVALFLALVVQVNAQSDREHTLLTTQLANSAAGALEREVARHQEGLESVSSFFESSDVVDASEFENYAMDTLGRLPNLQAMSYNPIVQRDNRADFEAYQRDVEGITGYQVTERNNDGELITAGQRDEYVPVGFIEPLPANKAALGFDINSNPDRKEAIDRARALDSPSATGPIDLVQDSESQKGMLALIPVHDKKESSTDLTSDADPILGFAVGVYRLGDLLFETFSSPEWDQIDVLLTDVTDQNAEQEIAYRPAPLPSSLDTEANPGDAVNGPILSVYGREWQVSVLPTSAALALSEPGFPPTLSVLALIGITLLQAFLLLVTGLEQVARRDASDAHREANTDPLTDLENRRSFMRNLAIVRERSISEEVSNVLLSIDLDQFKQVNDVGGHEAGDDLLRKVASVLSQNLRGRDVVARIGGDEFAIVLNNCPLERGLQIAEALEKEVKSITVPGPTGPLSVGISIGVSGIEPHDGLGVTELLRKADDACYAAKRSGGGVRLSDQATSSVS